MPFPFVEVVFLSLFQMKAEGIENGAEGAGSFIRGWIRLRSYRGSDVARAHKSCVAVSLRDQALLRISGSCYGIPAKLGQEGTIATR